MSDDNLVSAAQSLSPGRKYINTSIVYIDKIQQPNSPTNEDVSENNYYLNNGNLNAEYSGSHKGKFIFKLIQDTTLTGQPPKILPNGTTITLRDNKGTFEENTNIINGTNADPKVGHAIEAGIKNSINGLSNLARNMYKGEAVLSGGKLSKTKSKSRKLKRGQRQRQRQHKKTKSRSKKRKSKKSRSRPNRK